MLLNLIQTQGASKQNFFLFRSYIKIIKRGANLPPYLVQIGLTVLQNHGYAVYNHKNAYFYQILTKFLQFFFGNDYLTDNF